MKQLHSLALAVIAMAALPVFAQQQADPAPAPAMAASMAMDCGKAATKRHDHGAERGLGVSATSMPCGPDSAASATAIKAKKKPAHDHAKFHKNQ